MRTATASGRNGRRLAAFGLVAAALVLVAALSGPTVAVAAGRPQRELNGLLDGVLGLLTGPTVTVTNLVGGLGTIGIVSTALSGALTIDFSPSTAPNVKPADNTPRTGPFLYVWNAYGNSYTDPVLSLFNKDFLATIDLNKNSPTYKQLISYAPLPTIGNEPHHISISRDRTRLVGSGLLSFLRLQDDIYAFDVGTDPRQPKFLKSTQLLLTATSDHVFGLKNGNILTTQMGSKYGGAPGGVSIFTKDLQLLGTYPKLGNAPTGFNPHGADVQSDSNLLVTSDFVLPVSTVTAQVFTFPGANLLANSSEFSDYVSSVSGITTRNTVRVWDLDNLDAIKKTIILPGAQGVIDIKIIPGANNPDKLAYATGVFNGGLYLVNPTLGIATEVLNFGVNAHPHLLAPANLEGTRFFLTLNLAGQFLYLDTTNPYQPKVLSALYFGAGSAPHYITPIAPGDKRVAVADYFLDQGVIGKVHARGQRKVYIIPFNNSTLDAANVIAFNFASLNGRPHGIATNYQYTDVEA